MPDLFPNRWLYDKPPTIEEFTQEFRDDYACAEYLMEKRWPEGFVCPHCGSRKAWRLETRPWLFECAGKEADEDGVLISCRKQTSLIVGTVMQGTHLPLRKWFIAAYLMATHSNSISALQLQPKIGVTYKTAWLVLHKLRKAMVDPDRRPLSGEIEADETFMPWASKEEGTSGEIIVISALERVGDHKCGRIRLKRIDGRSKADFHPFIIENTVPGSVLHTDMAGGYIGIPREHHRYNLSGQTSGLPLEFLRIHRAFSNLKSWRIGTFHGLGPKHLDAYLNEFVFRWNRRRHFQTSMDTMLGIGFALPRSAYRDIVGDTTEWKKKRKGLLKRRHKQRVFWLLKRLRDENSSLYWIALDANEAGENPFTVLRELKRAQEKALRAKMKLAGIKLPPRKPAQKPTLTPRRPGEERLRGGYAHPPRLPVRERMLGHLRHIPPAARVWA